MDKLILKLFWNCKGSQIAATILKKNKKVEGLTFVDFKFTKSYRNSIILA